MTEEIEPARHRAVDVPRLRDRLWEGWGPGGFLRELLTKTDARMHTPFHPARGGWPVRRLSLREWHDQVLGVLHTEDLPLYYVTPTMTDLVAQAAAAMPYYQVHSDRLPSATGFVVFGDTVCDVPREVLNPGQQCKLNAALWWPVEETGDGPGVMVLTLQDTHVLLTTQPINNGLPGMARTIERMAAHLGPLAYHEEYPLPYGSDPWGEGDMRVRNSAVASLICTWSLMNQRITVTTDEPLPRAVRRQYTRVGRPEPVVRTTTLRQKGKAVQDVQERDPDAPGRTYTKRWVVKDYGYWRNTWYPSRERHEQQFVVVPSYVKGPEGAPLIGGDRVNVLRR